jgi:hypothetical protein
VYTSDAMDRVAHAGKQILHAVSGRTDRVNQYEAALARVRDHRGMDTVAARRLIGDAVIAAGRYLF